MPRACSGDLQPGYAGLSGLHGGHEAAPVQMADGHGQGVSGVFGPVGAHAEKLTDHERHLDLFRPARTDKGFFDQSGNIVFLAR